MMLTKEAVLTMQKDLPVLDELLARTPATPEILSGMESILLENFESVSDAQHLKEIAVYLARVCLIAYFQGFDNDIDLGTRGTTEDLDVDEDLEDFEDEGEIVDTFSSADFL